MLFMFTLIVGGLIMAKTKDGYYNLSKICREIQRLNKELNEDEIARLVHFLIEKPEHVLKCTIDKIMEHIQAI